MDFPTFRAQYDRLTSLRDQTASLLSFAEDAMQSCPEDLGPLLVEARERCQAENLDVEAAFCDRLLGWLAFDRSDYRVALDRFEGALEVFQRRGERGGRLKTLNGIASVYSEQGRLETALAVYRDALTLAEDLGDPAQILVLRANIGETLSQLHQYQEAEAHFRAALDSGLLSPLNQSLVLNQLARSLIAQGRTDEARAVLVEATDLARLGPHLQSLATALESLGALDLVRGTTSGTQTLLEEARDVARQAGDRATEARAAIDLGRLALVGGRTSEARERFQEGRDLGRAIGTRLLEAEAWKGLASAWKAEGAWKEAFEAQERYHELSERLHDESVGRQVAQLRADQARRENELLKEQTRVLTLLGQLGQRINSSLDLETIILTLYGSIGQLMKADTFGLGLYHEERGTIEYKLFIEDGHRVPAFESPATAETFSAWCIRHRQDILVGDADKEYHRYVPNLLRHFGDKTKHSRSCIYTPLLVEDRVLGILSVQSYEADAYTAAHLSTFKTLAASIAVAVQNAKLFTTMNTLATIDALTGASTRRHLFDRTEEEFQRFRRDGVPLALVMIDLDHFKALNDTWGHSVGDRVLADFGTLCLAHKRPHDLFGRYGGEEFALVLARTTLEGALKTAGRLCRQVARMPIVTPGGNPIRVTASFGVTSFHAEDQDITRVFSRADEALYEAKEAGRNRVEAKVVPGSVLDPTPD